MGKRAGRDILVIGRQVVSVEAEGTSPLHGSKIQLAVRVEHGSAWRATGDGIILQDSKIGLVIEGRIERRDGNDESGALNFGVGESVPGETDSVDFFGGFKILKIDISTGLAVYGGGGRKKKKEKTYQFVGHGKNKAGLGLDKCVLSVSVSQATELTGI